MQGEVLVLIAFMQPADIDAMSASDALHGGILTRNNNPLGCFTIFPQS